eukprot:PhM_4_TR17558/c8_g5_i3/m.42630
MLSKIAPAAVETFRALTAEDVGTGASLGTPVIVAAFDTNSTRYAVASMHTQAYQNMHNKNLRRRQITHVASHIRDTMGISSFVITGDLNLHYVNEDAVILENNLFDVWMETRPDAAALADDGDASYTYDSKRNQMVPRYVPGENRRMRLDRILCSGDFLSAATFVSKCRLWADEPIDSHKRCALFVSDHFGLTVDVRFGDNAAGGSGVGGPRAHAGREELARRARMPTDASTYSMYHFAMSLPTQAIFLLKRQLGM